MNPIIFVLLFTFADPTTPPVPIAMFYDDTPVVLEERCNDFIIELKNDIKKRANKSTAPQGTFKCIPLTMNPGQNPN